jgi:hypothetical protein
MNLKRSRKEAGDSDDGLLCGNAMSLTERPAAETVRRHLDAVLASDTFARSERLRSFLAYVVDAELSGKAGHLKGYSIGIDVFARPTGFDAGTDPLVRVQAGKLRKLLDQYYDTEGAADTLRIRIARGSYVPDYEMIEPGDVPPNETPPDTPEPSSSPASPCRRMRAAWLPAPVSSHLALFSLLPLFFLAPTVYPDATNIGIANAQLTIAVHERLAGDRQSLPEIAIQMCWPAGFECRSLADTIAAQAGFHQTVKLLTPRRVSDNNPLSYTVRIENRSDGRAIFARLVHDHSGETVYAKYFGLEQLRSGDGILFEGVSFSALAFSAQGPLYRHALRTGAASSLMRCLSHIGDAHPSERGQPSKVAACSEELPDAVANLAGLENGGAQAISVTR